MPIVQLIDLLLILKRYFSCEAINCYYFEQLEPYTKPLDRWGGDDLEANEILLGIMEQGKQLTETGICDQP